MKIISDICIKMPALTKITKMGAQTRNLFRWLGLMVAITLMQACQTKPDQAPEGLIPMDKMGHILTEIHLAEARVNKLGLRSNDSSRLVYDALEKRIFQKYKIDTAAYNRSYVYYSSNPEKMVELYKQVTETLAPKPKPLTKQ